MAGQIQCKYCGAVLLPEDAFCGECGAPRPEAESPVPPNARPSTSPPPERPGLAARPVERTPSAQSGWRVAFIVLMVIGVLVCLVGVAAFLFAGVTQTEGWTAEENWLFSSFCCLLPIAGSGLILMLAGAGIWYSRLRGL